MAVTFKNLFSAMGWGTRQPTEKELTSDIAPAAEPLIATQATGAVRRPGATGYAITYSPDKVMRVLRGAQSGQSLTEFVELGLAALRRSPKLRAAMETRVLAVTGLPRLVSSEGTSRQDKKALAACKQLVETPHFKKLLRHLAWASYFGWQGAQNIFRTDAQFWSLADFKRLPAQWFVFDAVDGETPLLLPSVAGQLPQRLEPFGKYIFHTPALLPGLPHLNGLMYTAVFYAFLTDVIIQQGSQFVELFGMPMRLGKYPLGNGPEHKKNLDVMRRALEGLGADAWAMIPDDMQIEFLKDASVQGSIETYERWARYFDELLAQLVLGGSLTGGTSNTGSGGSQALGVVHNELRADKMRADADDLADTIVRDVFTPFVKFNFDGAVVPSFSMPVEEAEDVQAKAQAIQGFMDRGVKFLVSDVHSLLQTTEPQEGDDTVGGAQPAAADPQATATAANSLRARFAADQANPSGQGDSQADQPDEIDVLIDKLLADDGYVAADKAADEAILAAVADAAAGGPDAIKTALLALIENADIDAMRAAFTAGLTATRAAGELAVELELEQ